MGDTAKNGADPSCDGFSWRGALGSGANSDSADAIASMAVIESGCVGDGSAVGLERRLRLDME